MKKVLTLSLVLFITIGLLIPFKLLAYTNYIQGPFSNVQIQYHTTGATLKRDRYFNTSVNGELVLIMNPDEDYVYSYFFYPSSITASTSAITWREVEYNANETVKSDISNKTFSSCGSYNQDYNYTYDYWNKRYGDFNTSIIATIASNSNQYGNSQSAREYAFTFTSYYSGNVNPPVNYGDLIDVGFYTNFTNSQQSTYSAMKNNVDTIKWNGFQDSSGNSINTLGFRVQIQAAVVDYEANTKSDLLNQTISDMITGDWTDLITISANIGEKSFTWENVAQTLLSTNYNLDFWNKLSIFQGYNQQSQLKYMKEGWIYRIRLINLTDEYEGDWQIVYTLQGAPAGDSEGTIQHIYNYNTTIPEQTVYNDCDNINNYNNTTNNWYMNDTPMDVSNDTETWVEKLIKFIIGVVDKIAGLIDKLINIILDVFGSILDGLVDMILELFDGLDLKELFFGWFSDLKDYIESIDLTLPVFNLPEMPQVSSFNRLVQETMNIFINNNLGFVIFIPLILLIVRLVL